MSIISSIVNAFQLSEFRLFPLLSFNKQLSFNGDPSSIFGHDFAFIFCQPGCVETGER